MVKKKEPSRGDVNAPKERLSLIELLIVVAIILIIAAIAIPNLLRARMNANDSAAASSMRTINTAQVTYVTQYPGSGYAPDLTTLGANGTKCGVVAATSAAASLLDDQLGCTTAASAGPLKVNNHGHEEFLHQSRCCCPGEQARHHRNYGGGDHDQLR